MTQYWWVNQSQSYEPERREGILWAPMRTADGRGTRTHWENMDHVEIGDVILHYAQQRVRAISTASASAVKSRRPQSLPTDMWEQDGRLLRASYRDAVHSVGREEIPRDWRLREPSDGPFQINAGVKVGYLFPLTERFFKRFNKRFGHRFESPPFEVAARVTTPPEALAGADDLLRRLIGIPLSTASGRTNIVLGVRGTNAIVRTERSPDGQPVPVAEVQQALDTLVTDGVLFVTPETIGHRSSFIGAVLATLPGAVLRGSPPTLELTEPEFDATLRDSGEISSSEDVTFEGDLAVAARTMARGEQTAIRNRLFGSAQSANCALCGEQFPVKFLYAAHIKRRAVATEQERRDIAHIAMPACVFGCDALFESGYISVDDTGHVIVASVEEGSTVGRRLLDLHGRGCIAYSAHSAGYFQWHRENVWRAAD